MIVRPNPLEQLAGGDRHRNYPGPRDFLEDFLEGEGAATSSLLCWNLTSNPASPNLNPDNSENSGSFQLRVIPKIPRIFRQKVLKFPEFSGSPCKALTSSQIDRKRRRGIRRGGRRAKIGVEPVAFYGDISKLIDNYRNFSGIINSKRFQKEILKIQIISTPKNFN